MNKSNISPLKNLKYDIPSSIVVFLVALPLCLGIALASGAPLFSGIIAGIVGGIIVGAISGSPLGVSGPAAGLAVIVADSIKELGTNAQGDFDMTAGFQAFLVAGLIAGIIQLVLGALKAGIIAYYFPSSVIKGMLAGIGITLILKQIPHAFGWDKNPEGEWAFFQSDGHNTFSEIMYSIQNPSYGAIIITVVSLVLLILFQQQFMKKNKIIGLIPGPLVVVGIGIMINEMFGIYFPELVLENEMEVINDQVRQNNHLVNIKAADSALPYYGLITFPDFSILANPRIYLIGFTMAIVASLETLLCVEATDKLDPLKRVTPTNRELFAQGAGNIVSSLIGGLPVTQVIVRSSANINSGGKTKMSSILHGVFLAVFVLLLPWLLNKIPLSCLAAILLVVGYKLANIGLFKMMYKDGWGQFIPFIVTIIFIIGINLLWGIALGLVVSIFYILRNNFKVAHQIIKSDEDGNRDITIQLSEDVTFLNKASVLKTLEQIPDDSKVTIDASNTHFIHCDVIEILEDFEINASSRNIEVKFIDLNEDKQEEPLQHFKIINND
ncbi:MAG: SulP family inorganic anion transporter [Flavobacteriales bacterium]|jgi:MFS superfamily sulfate permease-like transporter|nr:SulP family inorganic anion transporter [Flavobacteriales bacterium]